jgi:PAS domain S-box-containing protein
MQTVWIVEGSPGAGRPIAVALAGAPELACEVLATAGAALERLAAGEAPAVLVLGRDGADRAEPDRAEPDRAGPDRAGLDACRRIRAMRDPHQLPILLVLAHRDSESVALGLAAGANDCLGEPYVSAELVARVTSLASSQRRYRRALEQSEDRLRRVLEASGAGLWELDVDTGAVEADQRVVELMGLPEGARFTLASGLKTLSGEDRDLVVKSIDAALRGENDGRYLVCFRTGGQGGVPLRWVESRATAQFDRGRPVRLAGTMVDITARKHAELERQGLIEAITAQPMLRVAVLRGPELVFEMASAAYKEQVGRKRDFIGRPIREAFPEYDGKEFVPQLLEVMATGVPFVSGERTTYFDRGDGVLVPTHFSVVYQPLRGKSGRIDGVIVFGNDITEAVNARQELQASRARLQLFFEQAPAVIALLDGPDHRFVLANEMYYQLVGRRDLVGRTVAEALPEVVEQGFIGLLDNVRRTGVPYRGVETWIKFQPIAGGPIEDACLNFVYQPVRGIGGDVESIFVHAVDITEMVRAREQARQAALERAGAYDVLEHGDPTFIVDADWRFTFANAAWLRWTGLRREAVLGELMWDLIPQRADAASEYHATYHRAMHERVPAQLTHHDAAANRWVWLSLHPTTDGGLATFIRDVTAEKRAEAELRGRSDFERQLIGIVSHDLRIPLSVIRLGTQALLTYQSPDEKSSKMLARIQSAAERGARMVNDLLDFTQARVGGGIQVVPSEGNLHTILRQVVDDISTTSAGRVIRIEATGDGQGRWDLDRISQILMNLVTNAIKYSPPASEVTVRSESDATGVTVSIHNMGPSIPAAALARIFDPMQRATAQLENRARSVGLGLFIVKHLIEAHRGWIDVASTAEAGTTFRLWVPRTPGAP